MSFDAGARLEVLSSTFGEPLAQPERAIAAALAAPVGMDRSLEDLARGAGEAVVVVSDITRPIPYRVLLPPLFAALELGGIPAERTSLLVATGLHRASTPEERVTMFGERIAESYRVLDHDARDRGAHIDLGPTAGGTPVLIDRRYVEAPLRIVTSLVEPHLMAGFSGGRKAVCPGLAAAETIGCVHGARMLAQPGVETACIDDNPLHAELLAAARLAGCDFSVNVTIDRDRRMTGVFAGELDGAHRAACRSASRAVEVAVERPAEIVVTSSAGYPLDATFYQSIKGIVAAGLAVADGGTVVLVAECAEGLGGDEFRALLDGFGSPDEFLGRIHDSDEFTVDQWQLQMLCRVTGRARVIVVSDRLDGAQLAPLGLSVVATVGEALAMARRRHGADAHTIAMPEGPYLAPRVRA